MDALSSIFLYPLKAVLFSCPLCDCILRSQLLTSRVLSNNIVQCFSIYKSISPTHTHTGKTFLLPLRTIHKVSRGLVRNERPVFT